MADVDDLYALPPSEFTAARDTLAKASKDPSIGKLRRPTVGAWAVNSVVRSSPELVEEVYAAGAALGEAQRAALGGTGRDELRAASARRREAVAAAVRAAVALAGESHRDGITATFEAAAAGDESVRQGRLGKELDAPSGFGVLGELPDLPDLRDPEPEPDPAPAIDEAAVAAAEQELADARAALDDARSRVRRAEAALRDLRPG